MWGQLNTASTHLEAGALQDQVSRLDEIEGQLQVKIRAFTQTLQMTDQLGQCRVVQASIAQ